MPSLRKTGQRPWVERAAGGMAHSSEQDSQGGVTGGCEESPGKNIVGTKEQVLKQEDSLLSNKQQPWLEWLE